MKIIQKLIAQGKHRLRQAWGPTPTARRQAWLGLLFISPWLIGLLLLKIMPIMTSFGISLTNFDILHSQSTRFIWFDNYFKILRDQEAVTSIFGTMWLALLTIPAQLALALGLATLLNSEHLVGKRILRTLFFMPSIIPGASVIAVVFGFIEPQNGWLNKIILAPFGIPFPIELLGQNFIVIFMALWAIGPNFLIMLGAMGHVPQDLYESAKLDGAGPIYRFFHITIPMISPAIFFSLILNLVGVFGGAALLDQGQPFSAGSSAYDEYISKVMFSHFQFGYAASLAWIFFAIMLVIIIFLFSTSRYWVYYASGDQQA